MVLLQEGQWGRVRYLQVVPLLAALVDMEALPQAVQGGRVVHLQVVQGGRAMPLLAALGDMEARLQAAQGDRVVHLLVVLVDRLPPYLRIKWIAH